MKNVLATLNIGEVLKDNSRASFKAAAERWGCDYAEITEAALGQTIWSTKLCLFDVLPDADRICYIDADTVISVDCPSPFRQFPPDAFVAARNQQAHMPAGSWRACFDVYVRDIITIGGRFGKVPPYTEAFINSGFWVASRTAHAGLLLEAAEVSVACEGKTAWHDQSALNYILLKHETPVLKASDTWNYQFPPDTQERAMAAWIYHYSGNEGRDRIDGVNWSQSGSKIEVLPSRPKLLWVGDAVCHTGFARVTHNVLAHLAPKWDVYVLGINYDGGPHDYPYPIYPSRMKGDLWGLNWMQQLLTTIKPQAICVIQDPWITAKFVLEIDRGQVPMAAYLPVDARNQPSGACVALNRLDLGIFYTQFGFTQCRLAGYSGVGVVIPHGVDTEVYRPIDRSEARAELGLDALGDIFVIGNVNRNQPRKRLDLTVQCFAEWLRRVAGCRDQINNAYLYIHCSQHDTAGWDLPQLANYYGISQRLIIPDEHAVTPSKGLPESAMPYVYSAFDVQLTTSLGEGWGLSQMEGAACGVPQIVPQYAALGEWMAGAAYMIPCLDSETHVQINTVGGVPNRQACIEAIDIMYRHPDIRAQYAQKALDLAHSPAYSWANVGERFHVALTEMIERKRRNANL